MTAKQVTKGGTMQSVRIMDGARFAACGNCLLNIWSGPTKMPHIATFDALMGELAPHHRQGVVLFVVLEPGSPIPNAAERREAEAAYSRWAPSIKAVAQVVEGGNLWAVTARSVMTAIRLVQRRPYPIKVFSDVDEGAGWAAPYVTTADGTESPDMAQTLLRDIAALRALPVPKEGYYSAG